MTLVVYKNKVMAADSAVSVHNQQRTLIVGHTKKVYKSHDGWLIGCAGSSYDIQVFVDWFLAGRNLPGPRVKNMEAMVVAPDETMYMFSDEFKTEPFVLAARHYAIGTGGDFAMGALAAGASAVRAIQLTKISIPIINGCVHTEVLTSSGKKNIPFVSP
jgi:ATP-dependent protease HslVU (ClpYQ) peptidase subunit